MYVSNGEKLVLQKHLHIHTYVYINILTYTHKHTDIYILSSYVNKQKIQVKTKLNG